MARKQNDKNPNPSHLINVRKLRDQLGYNSHACSMRILSWCERNRLKVAAVVPAGSVNHIFIDRSVADAFAQSVARGKVRLHGGVGKRKTTVATPVAATAWVERDEALILEPRHETTTSAELTLADRIAAIEANQQRTLALTERLLKMWEPSEATA